MAPIKSKPGKRNNNGPLALAGPAEVLTLPEAAAYLRISEENLLRLVHTQGIPGRDIGEGWRFLKAALQNWQSAPPAKKGLLSQLGAIKDDPDAEEMLKEIYQRRGRHETEEA